MQATIGRQVWLWGAPGAVAASGQPFAATVVFVHSDWCVNLKYIDHAGVDGFASSVSLGLPRMPASPGENGVNSHGTLDHHGNGIYATWMPYQMREAVRRNEPLGQHPVHTSIAGMNATGGDPA